MNDEDLEEFINEQININTLIIKSMQKQTETINEQKDTIQCLFKEIKSLKEVSLGAIDRSD